MTNKDTSTSNRNTDSIVNTIVIVLLVSLVCSVLVSTTAILLKPIQQQNQLARSSLNNILPLMEAMQLDIDPETIFGNMQVRIVDLETGEYNNDIDVTSFDPRQAVQDPALSISIPESEDIAGIGQRAKYALVYLVREGQALKYILLPISGRGMWSTLYGYIVLEADADTIAAIKLVEHGETPGIGDKVDDPAWLQQWRGKLAYENGKAAINVVKRRTATTSPYEVDAITGATLTSQGVGRAVQYWLGEHGFQSYLAKLQEESP